MEYDLGTFTRTLKELQDTQLKLINSEKMGIKDASSLILKEIETKDFGEIYNILFVDRCGNIISQ